MYRIAQSLSLFSRRLRTSTGELNKIGRRGFRYVRCYRCISYSCLKATTSVVGWIELGHHSDTA
jgi:hypothetical protein